MATLVPLLQPAPHWATLVHYASGACGCDPEGRAVEGGASSRTQSGVHTAPCAQMGPDEKQGPKLCTRKLVRLRREAREGRGAEAF